MVSLVVNQPMMVLDLLGVVWFAFGADNHHLFGICIYNNYYNTCSPQIIYGNKNHREGG